ncbi:MAG: bifunctional DNA-binding transcriptional regulator/O6-methylguanine-DNA methyltransferase Ada [Proteobacteria bacterium]|nr:bifunctional DNA-binding transcriptional regulator/O6-methylguanine-DNA methyltransferase Ada [Pseudomonadota bacterium]
MFDAVTDAARLTDDQRYDAFARRDKGLRDAFVMGVVTTGVYCRAGCPARTPNRENVRFFDTPEQARATGLRACKRCKPDEAASPNAGMIAKVCRLIEDAEETPSLETLADRAGMSPFHFHRVFKAETGVTPAQYGAAVRDRKAKAALGSGASVTEAVYDAGYGSASRFYDGAESRFGMAPKAWRDQGKGEAIRVAVAPSSLGQVLVGATDKGVCAVELGDDAEVLLADFQRRFSNAVRVDSDPAFKTQVQAVIAVLDEAPGAAAAALPTDVRGTAFQHRVWDALRRIPRGQTWTYAQVAEAIGAPKAVRAVGAACGANPIAVLTPCHRVVGSSRGPGRKLTGYRWGVEKKRALLEREGA